MGTNVSRSKRQDMPLFRRRQSDEARKRMEHQLYLARESRGTTFDLSRCEISEVPTGVFSLCRVMLKEVLLLHDNFLRGLTGGGKLKDLENLRVLDLAHNELPELPLEFGQLRCLQVLNLQSNKFSRFPLVLLQLPHLQTLNLKGNKLKSLPREVSKARSLRCLDVSDNKLSRLPKELSEVRTLENLVLSAAQMDYPPADVCAEGTQAVMQFLCAEHGIEYEPPSKYTVRLLDKPDSHKRTNCVDDEEQNFKEEILQYEKMKEEKRRKLVALEKQFVDDKEAQTQLAMKRNHDKIVALESMVEEEYRLLSDLRHLQSVKDAEHKQMVDSLALAEQSASHLIQELLEMNEKAKKREAVIEKLEKEADEQQRQLIVLNEESAGLRKMEILGAMGAILMEQEAMEAARQQAELHREESKKRAQMWMELEESAVRNALDSKKDVQSFLRNELSKEIDLQREAFEALLRSRDAKTQRLVQQIALIEHELLTISTLEIDRHRARSEMESKLLAEKRQALVQLLSQLCAEKDTRAEQLKQRLHEMEERREATQVDYWLIQYQRLLDRKPQALIDQTLNLEKAVLQILEKAGAADFIPHFQRHRITIETLEQMTDEDLAKIGVSLLGVRRDILRCVDEARAAATELNHKEDAQIGATAPPAEDVMITARIEAECCICLETKATVLFLYCGHICCCEKCGQTLPTCPLCRQTVQQRVRMQS